MTERYTFYAAVQVYKIKDKISPPYWHDTFSFAVVVIDHSCRHVHRLLNFVSRVKTNYGKQSTIYRGTVIWNKFLSVLYGAKTLKEFKALNDVALLLMHALYL